MLLGWTGAAYTIRKVKSPGCNPPWSHVLPPFFIVLLKIFNQNIKNRVKDFLKHL